MNFIAELRRRRVIRVAIVYAITAWLLVQIAVLMFETYAAPEWVQPIFVGMLVLGLPIALILAWAFEITPDGVQPTRPVEEGGLQVTRPGRSRFDIVIIGLLVVAVGWLVYRTEFSANAPDSTAQQEFLITDNSVAVLPFINMTTDPEIGFIADGLTEEILDRLARHRSLRVASRSSTLVYRGEGRNMAEVGAALGVSYLLEGSIRRSGDTLRITTQLIRAVDDEHIWSQSFEQPVDGGFDTQSALASTVARYLRSNLQIDVVSLGLRTQIVSDEAFLHTILAFKERQSMLIGGDGNWNNIIENYNRALELESDSPVIHVMLAEAYNSRLDYTIPLQEAGAKAKRHLDGASVLQHTPLGSGYFATLAQYYINMETDYDKALDLLDKASALNPNFGWFSGWRGLIAGRRGNIDEAVDHWQRGADQLPGDAALRMYYGRALADAGDFTGAIRQSRIGLEILDSGFIGGILATRLATYHHQVGDDASANKIIDQLLASGGSRSSTVDGLLALAMAAVGRHEEVDEIRRRLTARAERRYVLPDALLVASIADGDMDAAFEYLRQAIAEKGWVLDSIRLPNSYSLPMQADPRWPEMMVLVEAAESGN